jgi:hypothetical protein
MVRCTLCAWTLAATVVTVAAQERRSKPEEEALALARQTLSAALSIPPDRITTISVAPAQWRDSSLGCPERGIRYLPVLTSGYDVRLGDMAREHVVHVAGTRAVVCGTQSDQKPPPVSMIAGSLKAADAVRTALAARLGIEPARVRIVSTRPYRSTTPCPAAPAAPKTGALIVEADAATQTFLYYADDTQALSCDK